MLAAPVVAAKVQVQSLAGCSGLKDPALSHLQTLARELHALPSSGYPKEKQKKGKILLNCRRVLAFVLG